MRSLAALLFAILLVSPASAQDDGTDRRVRVSAEGSVRVAPDMAMLRFGIVTPAETAPEAREQNAEAASRAMEAVRELGVPEERIQLSALQLQPQYRWEDDPRRRVLVGYEAVRIVTVRVHELDRLPDLVAEVVDQGANRLDGVSYGLQDEERVRLDALARATKNAQAHARVMTEALGVELGEVVQLQEQGISYPGPRPMEAYAMAADAVAKGRGGSPEAFAAGEVEITASVSAVFAIE